VFKWNSKSEDSYRSRIDMSEESIILEEEIKLHEATPIHKKVLNTFCKVLNKGFRV